MGRSMLKINEKLSMTVITRFAPSPTGVLHTGSARTALFSWLFARKHGGKFYLRIEDTDQERSKAEHTKQIIKDLEWLGIDWDGDIVYQMQRIEKHKQAVQDMLNRGTAYKCYTSIEEIEKFREENTHKKFVSKWRDASPESAPDRPYVVRLKSPTTGETVVNDLILGEITFDNSTLDDMVLLRSDGTPTYMLAVVVDDHDMGITHIIRGDDHLTNAFRQTHIYKALGWAVPEFAHIPLIHDKNGRKLSKREGALGVENYIELGYLPNAVFNHLLRLGWSHGDEEIITVSQAKEWFDLAHIGKSPARFDLDKLNFINAHYMRELSDSMLMIELQPFLEHGISEQSLDMIKRGLPGLKLRANTLKELAHAALIYVRKQENMDEKSQEIMAKLDAELKRQIIQGFDAVKDWTKEGLHDYYEQLAQQNNLKLPAIMQPLRALLLGTFAAPGIFEVMEVLGRDECKKRVGAAKAEKTYHAMG